jgi:hypothetical protein
MAKSGEESYWIGRRAEVPVWTDTWMQGDRYGTVVKIVRSKTGELVASVALDKSGRVKKFRAADLIEHGMPGVDYPKESGI